MSQVAISANNTTFELMVKAREHREVCLATLKKAQKELKEANQDYDLAVGDHIRQHKLFLDGNERTQKSNGV